MDDHMYWFNGSINDMKNEIINDKINSIENSVPLKVEIKLHLCCRGNITLRRKMYFIIILVNKGHLEVNDNCFTSSVQVI